jgi:hypothetical protein
MSLEDSEYINRITLELMVNKNRIKNYVEVDDTTLTQDLDINENLEQILEITKELILGQNDEQITEKYSREMMHTFQKYAILCIKSRSNP